VVGEGVGLGLYVSRASGLTSPWVVCAQRPESMCCQPQWRATRCQRSFRVGNDIGDAPRGMVRGTLARWDTRGHV
jgi:hypothetical protein